MPAVGIAQVPLRTAEPLNLPAVEPIPEPIHTVPIRGVASVPVNPPPSPPSPAEGPPAAVPESDSGNEGAPEKVDQGEGRDQEASPPPKVVGRASVVRTPDVMPLAMGGTWIEGYPTEDSEDQSDLAERRGRANQGRFAS